MMIKVHYYDNSYDLVNDRTLQRLIEAGKIMRFERSTGWVVIGFDEVRLRPRATESADSIKYIRVLYNDNRYDYVSDVLLDRLLETNRIIKFERSDGWATPGVDPLRKEKRTKQASVNH